VLRGVLQDNFVCILMLNKEFQRSRRRLEDNIKTGLTDNGWGVCDGLIWLRIGTSGELL
jgi:hypothetical protein